MKATSEEIYSKSTICDFLLMVNTIVTAAAILTVCEIFSGVEVENRHFRPLYCDCSPLAEERPADTSNTSYDTYVGIVNLNGFLQPVRFCH